MKITCQTCHAKYTVADEKVVGRIAKIKCKKCSSTIVVNGNDPSLLAAGGMPDAPAGGAPPEEDDGATRVFAESPSNAMSGAEAEWTVNLSESDQPTMTTAALAQALASGAVPMDTYVWRDSLPDWTAAGDIPELQAAMRAMAGAGVPAAPAYAPPPAQSYAQEPDEGLGATMMMPEGSRPAAPAPAQEHALSGTVMMAESPHRAENTAMAARKDKGRGSVDLFGARSDGAAPKPPVVNYGGGSQTGERNENSVLFSLSALTATENAAKAPKARSEAGVIDFTPAKSPPKTGGRAAMDDLMNISGGGFGAAPVLAPPPLLAPVVEAPPPSMPPPSLAPVAAAPGMPQGGMGGPMMYIPPAAPQKKSPLPIILGAVAAVAVLGAVALFLVGGGDKPTTPGATATEQAATTAAPPTATETAAPPVTPPPADTAVAAVDPGEKDKGDAVDPGKPASDKEPKGSSGSAGAAATSTKTDTKTKEPAAAATPPPAETAKPAETAAPAAGGSGNEFSRSAATSALGAAAGSARSCKKPDGPTGTGKVKVTFAPSGNVTSAQVQGAPFAGTSVGGCVAGVFRGAHVPPFDGSPVTVTKSFTIN